VLTGTISKSTECPNAVLVFGNSNTSPQPSVEAV
jgi:hypothetical protein